jgi:excisionase family DNA binding protein
VTLRLELPDDVMAELVERAASRAAELVLERLGRTARDHLSPYLSVDEAAELLRCKPQRIYDLRSSGVLARFGDGSRALVSRAELEAHLAGTAARSVAHPLPTSNGARTARRLPR